MRKALTWMLTVAVLGSGLAVVAPLAQAQTAGCGGSSNDCFANASTLSTSRPASFVASNQGATLEEGEPFTCYVAGASVWFRFTAQTNGRAYVHQTQPSPFDLSAAAFEGTELWRLTQQDCDGVGAGDKADLDFTCVAGRTYYIQIASASNQTGSASFSLEGCGRTGPTASTGRIVTVSDHESTSATACWSLAACRQNADVDVNARVSLDRTTSLPDNQGIFLRLESSGKLAGRSYSTGEVSLLAPMPPPPPGPGPTGLPDLRDVVGYPNQLRAWIEEIEIKAGIFQPILDQNR